MGLFHCFYLTNGEGTEGLAELTSHFFPPQKLEVPVHTFICLTLFLPNPRGQTKIQQKL